MGILLSYREILSTLALVMTMAMDLRLYHVYRTLPVSYCVAVISVRVNGILAPVLNGRYFSHEKGYSGRCECGTLESM